MKTPKYNSALGFDSPIGPITVRAQDEKISSVSIGESETYGSAKVLNQAKKQILKMLEGLSLIHI